MAAGGMERVTSTPTVISAAVHFKRLPPREAIERMCKEHLCSFDSLAGQPKSGRWEPVALDLPQHLFFEEVATEAELQTFAERTMVLPIKNKAAGPWWEVHAVSTADGSKAMLFFRVEHACADGVGLTQVLRKVCTAADGSALPTQEYTKQAKPKVDFCATLCAAIKACCKYAVLPFAQYDSDLPIMPPLAERKAGLHFNGQRRLVCVPPHSLASIKHIKAAAGGKTTVNDVVFAAFAGAIRRYWSQRMAEGTTAAVLDAVTLPLPVASPCLAVPSLARLARLACPPRQPLALRHGRIGYRAWSRGRWCRYLSRAVPSHRWSTIGRSSTRSSPSRRRRRRRD